MPIKSPATVPTGPPRLPAIASLPITVAALLAVKTNPEVINPKVPDIPNWTANFSYSDFLLSIKFWMLFSIFIVFVCRFDINDWKFVEWIPDSCNVLFKLDNKFWFSVIKFWKKYSEDFFKFNNIWV